MLDVGRAPRQKLSGSGFDGFHEDMDLEILLIVDKNPGQVFFRIDDVGFSCPHDSSSLDPPYSGQLSPPLFLYGNGLL